MLAYWVLALIMLAGWQVVPPDAMYSDFDNPLIVAWNWSFFPIDVAFAFLGLLSRFVVRDTAMKDRLGLIGLTLMFCAGLMALTFWLIQGWFDPFWWGMNLWLVVLPILAFRRILTMRTIR